MITIAQSVYSTAALNKRFDDVYNAIGCVYHDIAQSHVRAAKKSIESASIGTSPNNEIYNAIGTLRSAYQILKDFISQKRTTTFLLFFKTEENKCKNIPRTQHIAVEIALIIHCLYLLLDDQNNACEWKNAAKELHHQIYVEENKYLLAVNLDTPGDSETSEDVYNAIRNTLGHSTSEKLVFLIKNLEYDTSGDYGYITRNYYISEEGKAVLRNIIETNSNAHIIAFNDLLNQTVKIGLTSPVEGIELIDGGT